MRSDYRVWQTALVRWGDMDAFGHVNNTRYFTYCESARIRWFEAVELDRYRAEESHGPALAQASLDFRRQVRYPATLEVGARATRLGRTSFTLDYLVVHRGGEEPVAEGTSVVVWVDYAVGRPIPLPAALRERIAGFDGLAAGTG